LVIDHFLAVRAASPNRALDSISKETLQIGKRFGDSLNKSLRREYTIYLLRHLITSSVDQNQNNIQQDEIGFER
jgi:hypothetical protein